MIKKVLFTILFLFTAFGFCQQKSVSNLHSTPNPFKKTTIISFESKQEQGVLLTVRNVLGKTVFKKAYYTPVGERKIVFNRENLASGVYIYIIQSKDNAISKRFVIE